MESCFLDGKKSNSAKMVVTNFLAHSVLTIVRAKIRGKSIFSPNPIKKLLLRYLGMQNSFYALKIKLNPTVFEKNAKKKKK